MPAAGGQPAPCSGFADLSAAQQAEILAALRRYDCSAAQTEQDVPSGYYVACDDGSNGITAVYLLGHVIVASNQIAGAHAEPPSISLGQTQWTVNLTLTDAGADSWHAWTAAYHTSNQTGTPVQTSAQPPCGGSAVVPCSDFVAFTLDGQVLSAPVTLAVLDKQTQISGSFTRTSATKLASALAAGALPVPLRLDSVEVTH
jgi:preprotein translocase subunit SecD